MSVPASAQPSDDSLMTVRQVAEFFQVTETTVRNWISGRTGQPKLPAVKRGKGYRIWKSDCVAYGKEKYNI